MNGKKAKALRNIVKPMELEPLSYKVINKQTKWYNDLLGNTKTYEIATIILGSCQRKEYKELKKSFKR